MRTVRLLWRVLFYRPLILVLLILVYAVGTLLAFMVGLDKSGPVSAMTAALAAGGLAAVMTRRLTRFSRDAGMIGLPEHARLLRRAQIAFLVIFAATPAIVSMFLGASLLGAVAVISAATGFGILVAMYPSIWILLIFFGNEQIVPLSKWARYPIVQALAVAASALLLWWWFDLPAKAETVGGGADARYSDARHERRNRSARVQDLIRQEGPSGEVTAVPLQRVNEENLPVARDISKILALGLGYSIKPNWRNVLYGIGAAVAALAIWKLLHRQTSNPLAYTCVTAVSCFSVMGALQRILRRWKSTEHEQSLLRLTPMWPQSRRIKQAYIETTLIVQCGTMVAWASASVLGLALGLIDGRNIYLGFVAMLATSSAFTASAWTLLAQRRIYEINLPTIIFVVMVGVGTAMVLSSPHGVNDGSLLGIFLIAAPPAAALTWYSLSPLRFPVNVDPRALSSKI
jgi:hypothetical protein